MIKQQKKNNQRGKKNTLPANQFFDIFFGPMGLAETLSNFFSFIFPVSWILTEKINCQIFFGWFPFWYFVHCADDLAKKKPFLFGDRSWAKNWCKFWFWSFDFGGLDFGVLILGVWILEFWFRILRFDFGSWSFDFGGLDLGVLILGEPCVSIWCFKAWGWENNFRPLVLNPQGGGLTQSCPILGLYLSSQGPWEVVEGIFFQNFTLICEFAALLACISTLLTKGLTLCSFRQRFRHVNRRLLIVFVAVCTPGCSCFFFVK